MVNPCGPHHFASSLASANAANTTGGGAGSTRSSSSVSSSDVLPIARCYGAYAAGFSHTETCWRLSPVNGSRRHPSQRSRRRRPASRAIRSSSAGHT